MNSYKAKKSNLAQTHKRVWDSNPGTAMWLSLCAITLAVFGVLLAAVSFYQSDTHMGVVYGFGGGLTFVTIHSLGFMVADLLFRKMESHRRETARRARLAGRSF